MSEEEIIKDIDNIFYNLEDMMSEMSAEAGRAQWQRFKDLYQKEKEKNIILEGNKIGQQLAINELQATIKEQAKNSVNKDKIKAKIEEFKGVKEEILKTESELGRASITYDLVRNDYCEKMLQELLEEED